MSSKAQTVPMTQEAQISAEDPQVHEALEQVNQRYGQALKRLAFAEGDDLLALPARAQTSPFARYVGCLKERDGADPDDIVGDLRGHEGRVGGPPALIDMPGFETE